MLTWRGGLLVVVFKKPLAFFSEKSFSSCSSHPVAGRTSWDSKIESKTKLRRNIFWCSENFHNNNNAGNGKAS